MCIINNNNQSPILFYFILFYSIFLVRTLIIWCIIALVCNTHIPQFLFSIKELAQFLFFKKCMWRVPNPQRYKFMTPHLEGTYLPTYLSSFTNRTQSEPSKLHQIFLRSITFQKFLGIRALCWTHTSQGALIPRTSRLWILYLTH